MCSLLSCWRWFAAAFVIFAASFNTLLWDAKVFHYMLRILFFNPLLCSSYWGKNRRRKDTGRFIFYVCWVHGTSHCVFVLTCASNVLVQWSGQSSFAVGSSKGCLAAGTSLGQSDSSGCIPHDGYDCAGACLFTAGYSHLLQNRRRRAMSIF